MKSKALPRAFKISIAVIICFTIFVFSFLGISIHNMSEKAVEDIGLDWFRLYEKLLGQAPDEAKQLK